MCRSFHLEYTGVSFPHHSQRPEWIGGLCDGRGSRFVGVGIRHPSAKCSDRCSLEWQERQSVSRLLRAFASSGVGKE